MRSSLFLTLGVVLVGSLVVVACVGDAAVSGPTPAAQGALDGPCFANGTCNGGLTCEQSSAGSKCGIADSSVVVGADAGTTTGDDAGTSGTADAGELTCTFKPTSYPCTGAMMGNACYGATQACSLTGCSLNDGLMWTCFGPNQCGGLPCCLSTANAALHPGVACAQGTLEIVASATGGAACGTGSACTAGDTQLCQFNAQCPKGQICSPARLVNDPDAGSPSLTASVLGTCTTP